MCFYQRLFAALVAICMMGNPLSAFAEALSGEQAAQKHAAQEQFELLAQSSNPYIAALAKRNLKTLAKPAVSNPRERAEVRLLAQRNNSLAVPLLLDARVMATFIVDTGATHTVITPRTAKKLGIDVAESKKTFKVMTANGTVEAPVVMVPSITIGGMTVRNVEAVVTPLGDDLLLAGLLGMNFFQDMELTFKGNTMVLVRDSRGQAVVSSNR